MKLKSMKIGQSVVLSSETEKELRDRLRSYGEEDPYNPAEVRLYKPGQTPKDWKNSLSDEQYEKYQQYHDHKGPNAKGPSASPAKEWFKSMTPEQQKSYLKDHPGSKYAE